ncbi:APC family permease [Amycolatopsis sp. NPDC088138]|uniref:APC family permease n=1 Tax=Amycolatopsis sp. NPDC088138 TaxID=3363938 RepID=UPI0037F89759
MSDTVETRPGLRRSLSVWQAVGLSVALMAPSMAANINPQQTAAAAGRAVPLAFLLSAVGVLLVAYGFVKLCQYYQHAGSVYAFVGATLGPRAGVVSGIGLLGTYTFYAVVTSSAAGTLGTAFLTQVGIWPDPPSWGPFVLTGVALVGSWLLAVAPARRGTSTLLVVEGATIALILLVTVVILVRLLAGDAPGGGRFTLDVFVPETGLSGVFLGAVFGFLSFAGFEAAATLGEETHDPKRNIPRAILGTAIFGGAYFVVVTAVEMMAFGSDATAFHDSPSLLGDLGGRFVGSWVGDVISAGAAISAFGCCLACVVGGSRLLFALGRDAVGGRGIGRTSAKGTPVAAVSVVTAVAVLIIVVCAVFFGATASDTFAWSGSIGTLTV